MISTLVYEKDTDYHEMYTKAWLLYLAISQNLTALLPAPLTQLLFPIDNMQKD